jgi:hypothetical protein
MSVPTYDLASLTYDSATTAYDGGVGVPSNMPVVGVFIAFDDTPYVAEPVWTEITQYVRDVNVKRGRQDDLENFASGSANITLDNRLRLFDPFNTAGIYYGKLLPRRQIKVVAQYNSITYPIFRGYIAGFPVGYTQGGKDSTVQIDCFDALGLLAAETTSNDWALYYTLQANPTLYWRCNDSEGTTVIREYVTGLNARTLEANNSGIPRLYEPLFREVPPLANGLLSNAASVRRYMYENNGAPNTFHSPNPRLIFWMQGAGSLTQTYEGMGIIFSIDAAGAFTVFGSSNNQILGVYRYGTSNVTVSDFPFHVAIEFSDQNGNEIISLRINDTLQTFTSFFATPSSNSLGDSLDIRFAAFQEIAFYNSGLTAAQVTEIYEAGLGRINDSTANRFALLTTLTDFPAALTSFAATTVSSVSELTSTQYLLNELQTITDGESGELYVTSSGILKFVARDWFATSTRSNTSQMSFVDTGTGVYYDYASLRMAYDADLVRNDVTVSFTGNGNVNTTDATSVTTYGSASENLSTYLADPDQAETLSSYLVTIYKNPKLRVDPFMAKGQRNPTYDWQRLLALELLDRFTFVRTPSVGSAISQDMLLQSIEHRITAGTWETVVNGSARFTGWFTIGTSLIGGTDVLL